MDCDGHVFPRDAARLAHWLDELLPDMSEPYKRMLVFKALRENRSTLAE
jgi:hypothetical protein